MLAHQPNQPYNLSDAFIRTAELLRVIDGDTPKLRIDLGWDAFLVHDVRLSRLNTPENRGLERPAGLWVTEQVIQWFGDDKRVQIRSRQFQAGKYGRCLCDVYSGGRCLNDWLLSRRYAWPTNEHGSIIGPRDVARLEIPDEIKQQVRELQVAKV